MPPQVLTSGPKPCGGKNILLLGFIQLWKVNYVMSLSEKVQVTFFVCKNGISLPAQVILEFWATWPRRFNCRRLAGIQHVTPCVAKIKFEKNLNHVWLRRVSFSFWFTWWKLNIHKAQRIPHIGFDSLKKLISTLICWLTSLFLGTRNMTL